MLLLHWPLALAVTLAGIVLAIPYFKLITGLPIIPFDYTGLHLELRYAFVFCSFLFIVFVRSQELFKRFKSENLHLRMISKLTSEEIEEAFQHYKQVDKAVRKSTASTLSIVPKLRSEFEDALVDVELSPTLRDVGEVLQTVSNQLQNLSTYFHEVLHQPQGSLVLNDIEECPPRILMHDIFDLMDEYYPGLSLRVYFHHYTEQSSLHADIENIKHMLVEGLHYAQLQGKEDQAVLWSAYDTLLGYPLIATQGQIKLVPALCFVITTRNMLPEARPLYLGSVDKDTVRLPQSAAEQVLAHNQRIVNAHYGASELIESEGSIITQVYTIPLSLKDVRPQLMNSASH